MINRRLLVRLQKADEFLPVPHFFPVVLRATPRVVAVKN